MDDELRAWFEVEGLMRYAVSGDEHGEVVELVRGPVVALGARDDDFVEAPHPDTMGFRGKPLREMSMEEYNQFLFLWLEQAVAAGDARCANCGKRILPGDDLPDPETWDAIFIEKEIVAWMLVHFDCKRWLAKKLKGVHPFDLEPREPPRYDLSQVEVPRSGSSESLPGGARSGSSESFRGGAPLPTATDVDDEPGEIGTNGKYGTGGNGSEA